MTKIKLKELNQEEIDNRIIVFWHKRGINISVDGFYNLRLWIKENRPLSSNDIMYIQYFLWKILREEFTYSNYQYVSVGEGNYPYLVENMDSILLFDLHELTKSMISRSLKRECVFGISNRYELYLRNKIKKSRKRREYPDVTLLSKSGFRSLHFEYDILKYHGYNRELCPSDLFCSFQTS